MSYSYTFRIHPNTCVRIQPIADSEAQNLEIISKNFQFTTRRTMILYILAHKFLYSLFIHSVFTQILLYIQPIADRVAQNLEIISTNF